MLLTKSTTFIIGPVASLLGYIMNAIFWLQSQIGLANIGLCIILFTIVIYLILTPLTIQQQKFSRLSAKMNPEIQAIQKKYKGKNSDPAAMQKMNEETQAIYAKYGVNPMGSCLQLAIQMPILFALYRVIWNIPAYVDNVKNVFIQLAQQLQTTAGAPEYMQEVANALRVSVGSELTENHMVDILYKFKPTDWSALIEKFPNLADVIKDVQGKIDEMNFFLGLNIADSPMNIIMTAAKSGAILLLIGALMIPVLAAVTQWLNAKLMTAVTGNNNSKNANDTQNSMESTMKTMNTVMPLMSAFFCLTLPVGLGIYWIAGAVVRSIQQVVINKRIDNIDMDELMKQNLEKLNKKREKQGLPPQKMTNNAKISTRNIDVAVNTSNEVKRNIKKDMQKAAGTISEDAGNKITSAKPGSLAAKAMMVKDYNESHSKK